MSLTGLVSFFAGSSLSEELYLTSTGAGKLARDFYGVSSGKNVSDKYLLPTYFSSTSRFGRRRGRAYS